MVHFEANRDVWLTWYPNKFVLVKGSKLIGVFDSGENAYVAGVQRFGGTSFLIKQVLEQDPVYFIGL